MVALCLLVLMTWQNKDVRTQCEFPNPNFNFVVVVSWLSHVWLFCNPMGCSPLGSPVHGISQARILEWVAISFSRGSSRPRDRIRISCLAGGFFTTESFGKPKFNFTCLWNPRAFSVAQLVKNLPAMQETWVRFLGSEDSLEKGTATHSNILARRIPWTV